MSKTLSQILIGGLLWLCSAHAQAQAAESTPNETVIEEAARAFWWGDFDELERLHAKYKQPGQRTATGASKLGAFRDGLSRVFKQTDKAQDAYYTEVEALTLQWAQAHPNSSLAHVMHARALFAHAWSYRGGGYVNTVPPEAWEDFRKYVRRANEYLAANAKVAFTDSSANVVMLSTGRASDWSRDRLQAIAEDGLRKNPDDDGLYFAMLTTLLPKWGGSAVLVDRFILDAVARTRRDRGMEMYARLYSAAAADQFEHAVFTDSGAEWSKVMAGYRDLIARYPAPENHNRYAYFACLARDKPVLLELLEKIGEQPVLSRWGSNASRTFETCKRWARQL